MDPDNQVQDDMLLCRRPNRHAELVSASIVARCRAVYQLVAGNSHFVVAGSVVTWQSILRRRLKVDCHVALWLLAMTCGVSAIHET